MDIFSFLLILLLAFTLIFYLVFLGFILYWHEKKTTVVIVPALYTFEFFSIGFLVVAIAGLIINYGPMVMQTLFSSWL